MVKKAIRLTESDIHRIVKRSVNRLLNEMNSATEDALNDILDADISKLSDAELKHNINYLEAYSHMLGERGDEIYKEYREEDAKRRESNESYDSIGKFDWNSYLRELQLDFKNTIEKLQKDHNDARKTLSYIKWSARGDERFQRVKNRVDTIFQALHDYDQAVIDVVSLTNADRWDIDSQFQ